MRDIEISSISDNAFPIFTKNRIDHWDAVADSGLRHPSMRQCYHERLAKIYRFLVPEGKVIVEIGCGKGNLLAALKPSIGVGIDYSAEMLKYGRKKYPNLSFVEADIHNLKTNDILDKLR